MHDGYVLLTYLNVYANMNAWLRNYRLNPLIKYQKCHNYLALLLALNMTRPYKK